jgi:uroporphyrinogen III methyltransferase/synthase
MTRGTRGTDRRVARPGTVYLVGAGPGDPKLLTVRGRELLDDCDAIVADALANPQLLRTARADGRAEPIVHTVGKRGGDEASAKQTEINALLVRLARDGKAVVRLKGGDPFVFGRGSEEAQALSAADIPFEIVPGITAGIAAPAYAGIPVTHRGLATSVTFVTGHEDPTKPETQTDWQALARVGGTIVLYMGVRTLPGIARALIAGGMAADTPAAAIQWGTHPTQCTVVATLATLADRAAELSSPVITVIGPGVGLRDQVRWFDRPDTHPLLGRRVVVTRATAQAGTLSDRLRELGAVVLELPATRIEPLDLSPLSAALAQLDQYDQVIFSSQNAVRIVWDTLRRAGRDARAFAGLTVTAVGPATADALLEHGIAVDVVPERFVGEAVLDVLTRRGGVRDARILYPAAERARDVLPDGLRAAGAVVDVMPIYRSVVDGRGAAAVRDAITAGTADLVTFTSASGVRGYVEVVGSDVVRLVPAASIGPITTEAARLAGIQVVAEAAESTIASLVDAVVGVAAAARIAA